MGFLKSERPPEKWSAAYFRGFVESLRTAVNFLDENNFPNGIDGGLLLPSSVPVDKVKGMKGLHINYDFFSSFEGNVVTSTSYKNLGSAVVFSPEWLTHFDVALEYTAAAADVSNTSREALITLEGINGEIITDVVKSLGVERKEIMLPPEIMPTSSSTLLLKARVKNSTYPLTILSARIIIKVK